MIEWLRNKFASAVAVFFILAVIVCTITGGISGYTIGSENNHEGIGFLIGLVIGLFLGIISGILSFGFFATVIHISETCDGMVTRLDRLYSSQNNFAQNVSAAVSNEQKSAENSSLSKVWVCSKCGESNPSGTMFCRKCGK